MLLLNKTFQFVAIFCTLFADLSRGLAAGEVNEIVSIKREGPNIVFLISEDNSKHFMKLFASGGVNSPHIQKMAANGLAYQHAFSNSPVCSVARSTLITGTLTTRTGMHLHRKIKVAPMPEGLEMFPAYLRKAGYYTTNNAKKDYNAEEGAGVWDASSNTASWKNRPEPGQPFFHQETFTESHESRLHFPEELMRTYQPKDHPDQVKLMPQFPDTPLFRFTTAYHRDKIREIDDWVGRKINELEQEGLLEDTFVFYFGDHGGVLPGSKGYLFETGLNVPLVVRIPENWKHLVPYNKGDRPEAFVSFIDFAPTVLHLAGLDIPEPMDGKPFLGNGLRRNRLESSDEAYGHADRFDEKYEMVRSVRQGKWKYIRSFQPFYPDGLQNNYRYKMLAFAEWKQLFENGELGAIQSAFFEPKPAERLYNLENDPFETNNLAADPQRKKVLVALREKLNNWLLDNNDLGFLPENVFVNEALHNPVAYGKGFHQDLKRIIEINDWALQAWNKVRGNLLKTLREGSALEKYWAYQVAATHGRNAKQDYAAFPDWKEEENAMVQLRAIELMGILEVENPIPSLMAWMQKEEDPVAILIGMNSLVYFNDHSKYKGLAVADKLKLKNTNAEVKRRLDYLNGTW
ncbi:sulfatase family protein [Cyclobacterium plantarum]|uniref:sulfatase family protein n=1 Tax=Cyclobacterium plantarum TaxID=2716263 RepID=UPI003F6FD5E1